MGTLPLALLSLLHLAASGMDSRPPNVVFLLADDLGYGDLGCFGNPVIRTPRLDRLASEGLRLTNGYAAGSVCSPSRAGILTGRHPMRVGIFDIIRSPETHVDEGERTIPELLGAAGYDTFFAGKWHLSGSFADEEQPDPGDHGFDHWFAHEGNFDRDPTGFWRNGAKLPRQRGWMSELVVDEALRWLDGRGGVGPFCVFLWFSEPHVPVSAPESFRAPYRSDASREAMARLTYGGRGVDRRRVDPDRAAEYFGCVTMLDHHIGRLLDGLDARGLTGETLVLFTSDNGPASLDPTGFGSPGPLRGAKGHVHEGGIRVPVIVRWPERIAAGGSLDVPVHGTDFLPTLCALAGVDPPSDRELDGRNVLPHWLGESPASPDDGQHPRLWWTPNARGGFQVAMRQGRFKILARMLPQLHRGALGRAHPPRGWTVVRFSREAELGDFEVFDLRADPSESRDLMASSPQRFAALRARFVELHRELRDQLPSVPEWSVQRAPRARAMVPEPTSAARGS